MAWGIILCWKEQGQVITAYMLVHGGLHADFRAVSSTKSGVVEQASIVQYYAEMHGLKIHDSKTEVTFATDNLKFVRDEVVFSNANGYWWHRSLLSDISVGENIVKARKAF